ncbi:MAG: hypothetical protein ACYDBQ_04285 [Thermoplasmatota archaeon]
METHANAEVVRVRPRVPLPPDSTLAVPDGFVVASLPTGKNTALEEGWGSLGVRAASVSAWVDNALRYRWHRVESLAALRERLATAFGGHPRRTIALVEEAVASESAARATCEPGVVKVEAQWGLGAWEMASDHFVVDAATGKVLQRSIARKRYELVGLSGATDRAPVSGLRADGPSVTDEELAAIARAMQEVGRGAAEFGLPWVRDQRRLTLVASPPGLP